MFENFQPINDGVLVKLEQQCKQTKSGLFIPDEAQEKNQVGIVVHAGNSKELKSGDKIYYKKYIGHALDDEYIVLRQDEILGIMHG